MIALHCMSVRKYKVVIVKLLFSNTFRLSPISAKSILHTGRNKQLYGIIEQFKTTVVFYSLQLADGTF
jgi:hypothetical protein